MKKQMTILTALTVLTICSCGRVSYESGGVSTEILMESLSMQENEQNLNNLETIDRKIIKNGYIRFRTADLNKTKSLIVKTVQELNGYISNDNAYDNDYSNELEHRLTIRVPADKFDLFFENISESIDKLDSKSIDVIDVTEEYIDVETRINTKKDLRDRYRELLKQATKVDEILNIEKEVGNLQTEIESFERRMKSLNDRIAFSTITVIYYQKTTPAFGFSSKFLDGIKNGWNNFLWFIIGLSNLWVFIIVAAVTVYLIKLWRKKKKAVS